MTISKAGVRCPHSPMASEEKGESSPESSLEMIKQGAEARLYKTSFMGQPAVMKHRFPKAYRHPVLDMKLRRNNLNQEVRCILKSLKAGVKSPTLYFIDQEKCSIYMSYIQGMTAKDYLRSLETIVCPESMELAQSIGQAIAKLHNADIVHGDLTTSNFMVSPLDDSGERPLWVIDFGLGSQQPLPEDKAVDLYVLERAFVSSHPNSEPLVDEVLRVYKAVSRKPDVVLQKLAGVRMRGRKRTAFG